MICITSQKQRKNPLKHHQGQKWGLVLFSFNKGRILNDSFWEFPMQCIKNSKFSTAALLHCQLMFLDYSFDVSCKRSFWACSTLLTRAGSCPHSDLCPRDSFQELSVPGLNWIIIQTLPSLPASRIWINSNRELLLKDATEPPQQMNPKLWQRHRVSPETVFSMIPMTYLWMTRMPNGQNKPNPTVLLGVFICNTHNTIQYSW